MIIRVLMDLNDDGYLWMLNIQTEDKDTTLRTLKTFSNDVRYVEEKEKATRFDKGNRLLPDGSIVKRCTFFGDKVAARFSFNKSEYKKFIIDKAVAV